MTWKFISTVVLIFTLTNAQGQDQWDLKRCVDYALTNNISVKQADLQTRFSKLQLDLDKLARWPTANFQASSAVHGKSAPAEVSWRCDEDLHTLAVGDFF